MSLPENVERLLRAASRSVAKGNYTVYNSYRHELDEMGLSPSDYQTAVKRLADVLKV